MEVDALQLQMQLPLLPPISPTSAAADTTAMRPPRAHARRASITAALNDGPDLPSPRLALFTSPLLGAPVAERAQSPTEKRRRRLRSSITHAKQPRTPRSLKIQHYADSSPFHLTSPVNHLSLLSPSMRHTPPNTATDPATTTASDQPHTTTPPQHHRYHQHYHHSHPAPPPPPPAFLRPLSHLSSLGLTLSPPTLNWSTAASVLSEAELRANSLLCRTVSANVERVVAVDRLIAVDMRNELRDVEGEEGRVRDRRWRDEEMVQRMREDEERKEQHVLIAAEISRSKAELDATRAALLQERYVEWRYRDENVEAEEMADDQRLSRFDEYHAAQLRISLNKQQESAAWKNEWRDIQLQHQQRMAVERAASLARQQAEQQRLNAAYQAARLKAKQGRLQLTVHRAKPLTAPFLPPGCVAYFVAQLVAEQPSQSLDYPAPLSELRYAPFVAEEAAEAQKDGVGDEDGDGDGEGGEVGGVEVGWGCEWVAKSVAKTTLVLGWQCCDREQKERFERWMRRKERKRKKDAAAADEQYQQQQHQQASTRPAKSTNKSNKPHTKPSTSAMPKRSTKAATATITEQQLSAVKRSKKLKELRSHSHRHKLITRVLELGRVEFKLRELRERDEGVWKGLVEVSGVAWHAKKAAAERRRRRKRDKNRSVDADGADSLGMLTTRSSRPGTGTSSATTTARLEPPQPVNGSVTEHTELTKAERENQRLAAAHLTMHPSSLYPTRPNQKRSQLQLLLMTEKERQQYQQDEEHKERLRRDKDDKDRRRWTRKVGELWIELRLLPVDAMGRMLARDGDRKERVEEEEQEEEVEDDDEDGEATDGEEADDGEGDEEDEEDEEEVEQKTAGKSAKRARAAQHKPVLKQEKGKKQSEKKTKPEAESVSAEQLRSKAFPIMD